MKPHQVRYWLNPKIEDYEEFQNSVAEICDIYQSIDELTESNVLVYSTDEKMGVQATEHANPKQTLEAGQLERVDPEYIRHGTTGIIASRSVATGEIVNPLIQPTRKEPDFVIHISGVFDLNPTYKHLFVTDNLNTHMSESLVKFVAKVEGIDESSLGIKGKIGILKSMKSRAAFLTDRAHQIAFQYTPKHCSWLNQIECWFSILTRRLLNRRSSFKSIDQLEKKIRDFIDFYNQFLKKPFKWNYKGKLLRA